MKVLVPVKRVVDYNVKIRVKADQTGVETANVKMSMNPFDEIANEEAIRLKEKGIADRDRRGVSLGEQKCQETLRTALAMGADRAIHVVSDAELQPLAVAKGLKAMIEREQPQLVLLGKQAIDDDSNQTGRCSRRCLGWAQATFVSKLELEEGKATSAAARSTRASRPLRSDLPAIVTVDLRLNEPRYASLPNIMKAKKKPIDTLTPEELGVDVARRASSTRRFEEPPKRQAG